MSEQPRTTNVPLTLTHLRVSALRSAWWVYFVLLFLPFPVLGVVILSHSTAGIAPRIALGLNRWFLATMAYLAVALPTGLFYRRHLFIAYFRGNVVAPDTISQA